MALLSVTAVEAQNMYLRFGNSGYNDKPSTGNLSTNNGAWVYECSGSALSSYVSSDGKLKVRPRVDWGGLLLIISLVLESLIHLLDKL